jgi:prefoldin alpha subunit
MEIRVLEGTFNELSARQNLFERALLETRAALDALKGLSESNPDEVFIPVGGGVLLRSSPPNAEDVLLSVGANVVVQRKRVEAVAFLEGRAKEIENSVVSLLTQRNQIAARLEADRQALQAMVSRQNEKN